MPRLNGYDANRRIRSQQWGESMTIVALTDGDRRAIVSSREQPDVTHTWLSR